MKKVSIFSIFILIGFNISAQKVHEEIPESVNVEIESKAA